jgi:hypothetical protein
MRRIDDLVLAYLTIWRRLPSEECESGANLMDDNADTKFLESDSANYNMF